MSIPRGREGNRNIMIVRTLRTLQALQTSRPTLGELAVTLNATERTARRYVNALEEAHVPITKSEGRYRIEGRI